MRLIDADALADQLEREAADEWNRNTPTNWANAFCVFVDRLDEAPTIDAAPVRRGEWEMVEEKAFWVGDEGTWMLTGEPTSHKVPRCTRCKSRGDIVKK